MKKTTYLILLFVVIAVSCERNEEEMQLNTSALSGEWEVMAYLDDDLISTTFPLIIYSDDTSKSDSITLKDTATYFWNFQVKAAVNPENETFETQMSICEHCDYGIGIKILNGKVIGPDSIYLEMQFEDDEIPYGNTYQLKGHRKK